MSLDLPEVTDIRATTMMISLDVVLQILKHCDLQMVKTFSMLDKECKSYTQIYLKALPRNVLQKYFPATCETKTQYEMN